MSRNRTVIGCLGGHLRIPRYCHQWTVSPVPLNPSGVRFRVPLIKSDSAKSDLRSEMGLGLVQRKQIISLFGAGKGNTEKEKMSGLQIAVAHSEKPVIGASVTADMAQEFIQTKTRVCTSDVYRSRLPAGTDDASEGSMGLVMKIHTHPEGCVCDVLWDTGKAYGGYCAGYRGYHDLLVADPSSSNNPKFVTPEKAAKMPTETAGQSDEAEVEVAVGYLASAPRVTHVGGKHIWSSEGPLFSKE